ncbi:Broad specificity phosphatase PhoE [Paenibacillus uliginis N3/975]|uniref:Broad specificity phosphatase PhoE n=1 Tax=Paenibacillus uliginis N3/975 TaxID=1313296 RepID=A0A1X7H455_9BACL|nr:histidine phosphatase family protein [Paenibacillus uliginis]SMF79479.1 Broad specificity phosphatase PhoE [Paenibacillus uliginis N3/975]
MMELVFIRHGQGEHNLNVPDRLNIEHPSLTAKGEIQVRQLKAKFNFNYEDLFIISPTIRTIETANILTENLDQPIKYISPLVGPRMFPQNPKWSRLKCDEHLPIERIEKEYHEFVVIDAANQEVWIDGINDKEEKLFKKLGDGFITWIKAQGNSRVFIIAHDGTINSYRQLLGEKGLTRTDFLGAAGYYQVNL